MDDKDKIQSVKDEILGKIVNEWIIGDLECMLQIEKDRPKGNCNYPIALYTLCSMSYLGYLISKKEYKPDSKRINEYVDNFFEKVDQEKIVPHKKELTEKYRNGLAHEFFPKNAGISRVNTELFTRSKEGYWVMDADVLAKMFIRSVDILEKECAADDNLCLRMWQRFNKKQKSNSYLNYLPAAETPLSQGDTGVGSSMNDDQFPAL